MRKIYTIALLLLLLQSAVLLTAQIPAGYYSSAEDKSGSELKEALHLIIRNHTVVTYGSLWTHFSATDKKPNGTVWDIYSDVPGGTPPYVYQFVTDQCGNYSGEGDCYNREHSFPVSWWGGSTSLPMYTDLFHIYPTDGHVNGRRANYPYGEVSSPTWTSLNGGRLGQNISTGYSGIVFEPIGEYKGDLARSVFYMAVRYYGEDGSWPEGEMNDGASMKEWALALMMKWHQDDPVSDKEIARNDSIFLIQGNRNPFIDNPAYVDKIWGTTSTSERPYGRETPLIYPQPATDRITVDFGVVTESQVRISILSVTGRVLQAHEADVVSQVEIDLQTLPAGLYLIVISTGGGRYSKPLLVLPDRR